MEAPNGSLAIRSISSSDASASHLSVGLIGKGLAPESALMSEGLAQRIGAVADSRGCFIPRLSVKFEPWRDGGARSKEADAAFNRVRPAILASRRTESGFLICAGCGFVTATGDEKPLTPQGYFELHHLDDNHANNTQTNIAVACPFCHMPFHIGFNAMRGNGTMVFAPELSQADISRICAICVIGFSRSDALSAKAKQSYHSLSLRGEALRKFFGADFALNLANYLLDRDRRAASGGTSEAVPDDGLKDFQAIRFLPDVESPDLTRAADYWRRVYQHCDFPLPSVSL